MNDKAPTYRLGAISHRGSTDELFLGPLQMVLSPLVLDAWAILALLQVEEPAARGPGLITYASLTSGDR